MAFSMCAHARGQALPSDGDRPPLSACQVAVHREDTAAAVSQDCSLVDWLQEEAAGNDGGGSAPPSPPPPSAVAGQRQAQGHLSRISDLVEDQGPAPSGGRVESMTPDERGESVDGEDPRTWTKGIITGNLILRDERSGKSLLVPYDLAKMRAKFRSPTFATMHAPEERGPDLSQSKDSTQRDTWPDESVSFVQEDISRGELRAIALDLPSGNSEPSLSTCPRARTRWSHGDFSLAGDGSPERQHYSKPPSERQRHRAPASCKGFKLLLVNDS